MALKKHKQSVFLKSKAGTGGVGKKPKAPTSSLRKGGAQKRTAFTTRNGKKW